MKTNLFIVGFPKTGTTSLHNILNQHPDVCMSEPKEPMYFCTEIQRKSDNFHNTTAKYFTIRERNEYENCFKGYNREKIIGESSTNYIYDNIAPKNIYNYNTKTKIIIMIREPVDFIKSWYMQLKSGIFSETANTLEEALDLENDRRKGKHIPKTVYFPDILYYKDRANFTKYISNYFFTFPKEQIMIIDFQDFKNDYYNTLHRINNFLGIKDLLIEQENKNRSTDKKTIKNKELLYKLIHNNVSRTVLPLIPLRFRNFLHRLIINNFFRTKISKNNIISKEKEKELRKDFYDVVNILSNYTKEDMIKKWGYKK